MLLLSIKMAGWPTFFLPTSKSGLSDRKTQEQKVRPSNYLVCFKIETNRATYIYLIIDHRGLGQIKVMVRGKPRQLSTFKSTWQVKLS
jgi:hypothetical protein